MKTTVFKTGSLLLAISLLAACKKDSNSAGTGSSSQMNFTVNADGSTSTVNNVNGPATQSTEANAVNSNITWTSAIANISRLKFEAKKNNSEIEITTNSITNADLLAIPAAIAAKIDTGTYREIEIKVLLVKSSGTNIPLTLKGTYNGASGAVPIEIDFNENAIIKAEAENVTVTNVEDVTAKLTLHLNRILSGITAAQLSAAARVNGTVVISSATNASIYASIAANINGFITSGGFEKHHR